MASIKKGKALFHFHIFIAFKNAQSQHMLILKSLKMQINMFYHLEIATFNILGDFPGGAVVKASRCQCRGPGFDPWSGN